jgi:hypothetical protein
MRHRLMQLLNTDDRDDRTDAIVKTFWSRAKPLRDHEATATDAKVVDFVRWARSRGHAVRP